MAQKFFDPKKIVQKYVRELRKAGIQPQQILLYGSYAQGTADQWSDIDLVVISEDFANIPSLQRLELLSLATRDVNAPIEALGVTLQEIEKNGKDSILWEAIQKKYQVVYKAAA